MYYFQPPQNNSPTPNYAQVMDWENQRQNEEAMESTGQRFKGMGWDPVDVQRSGNCFLVHLRDPSGNYHTVTVDGNGNILQNQAGYQ